MLIKAVHIEQDHYLVKTINRKGEVKMKIAAVKAKPKPRRKVSTKLKTGDYGEHHNHVFGGFSCRVQ